MNKIFIVFAVISLIIFYLCNTKKSNVEGYVDVEKEYYQNENDSCNSSPNICTNFKTCCLMNKNGECRDQNLLGCQKFKIKCENKCNDKKTDDNGKKCDKNDSECFNKCIKTCKKVQSDCCNRLGK